MRLATYMPRHGFGIKYSEKHCLYTNDLDRIDSIPTPTPPLTTKSDVYDSNTYAHVVENVKKVSNVCNLVMLQAKNKVLSFVEIIKYNILF